MGIISKIKEEIDVLKGGSTKDKTYSSEHTFPDAQAAQQAFERARQKLFDVDKWSGLPGLNSTFELYDTNGIRARGRHVQKGDFIRIALPSPTPENWVYVHEISEEGNACQFTVNPSKDPQTSGEDIEHFFVKEATSTFRVELESTTLRAFEIGKNEGINKDGKEAGNRGLLNTLIAEGGWAGFQEFQWKKLTDYLVHKTEATKA